MFHRPKPVSQYLLEKMRHAGAREIYIVLRSGKWDIANYYGDGSRLGMHIAYVAMGEPYGPPFTLDQTSPFLADATVMFGFPDILFQPEEGFAYAVDRLEPTGADIVLGVLPARRTDATDVIEIDAEGRVVRLEPNEDRPGRTDRDWTYVLAAWRPAFTEFLSAEVRARGRAGDAPPEWPVGAVIAAAAQAGLHVNSTRFDRGLLDVGTPTSSPECGVGLTESGVLRNARPIGFWLVPAAPFHRMFTSVIIQLANEYSAAPFEPHITLHAGVYTDEDDVDALLGTVAGATEEMELICGETGHTDTVFKTLFSQFDDPRLLALHRQVRDHLTRSVDYALQPHLSLLYKELPQAVRRGLAGHYTFRGEMILFDHIAADAAVVTALNDVVARHSRWGFWKCFYRLRRAGHRWNHKRVHRVAIEVGTSIPSARVIRVLDDLIRLYGRPTRVCVDNGFTAEAFVDWCAAQRIAIGYIQPGKPDQNAFIERFNRTFREEVLDVYLFDSLEQVREITEAWLETYNTERPHDSLGQVPPLTFLLRPDAPAKSIFEVST